MQYCKVCGGENIHYLCPIVSSGICSDCCSNFHLSRLNEWESYLPEKVDLSKLNEHCLKCEGLTRNEAEKIQVEGFYSIITFNYDEKFVFSNVHGETYSKKKEAYLESFSDLEVEGVYHLAECKYELGKVDEAIDLLKKIEGRSENLKIPILLGKTFKLNGNYEDAKKQFNKALKYDDTNASVYRELGEIAQLNEEYHSSIHFYNQSLENLNADDEGCINDAFYNTNFLGLAAAYSKLEQYDEVIKSAKEYLKQAPRWEDLREWVYEHKCGSINYMNLEFDIYAHSTLYYLMAINYLKLNNLSLAEEYIDRAVELDSDNTIFAKVQGIIIGRGYGQREINKYEEELNILKSHAELRTSSITTLKSFSPDNQVIKYTGDSNNNLQNFLIKQIFSALRSVISISTHITPSIDEPADEDKYTDLFRSYMSWLTEVFGWSTHTQSRGGFTRATFGLRGGIGERDIVIKSQEDKDLMIGEALILKNADSISIRTHTEKNFGYDIQAANYHVIIIWGFSKNPNDLWEKYRNIVISRKKGDFPVIKNGEVEEIFQDVDTQSLKTFYTLHSTDHEKLQATVVHVYVDILNHLKRKIAESSREK